MAQATMTLRVVEKERYDQQFLLDLPVSSIPGLAPCSVRVRPGLFGFGSNNLAYCTGGDILHWWSAFPIPADLPEPYNDGSKYGVPPGWGYSEIIESTIPDLQSGTFLYGFVPLSAHLVDLELKQSGQLSTNWIEVSKPRQKLMPLYKRYEVVDDPTAESNKAISAFTCGLVWGAGYVLNRFCFASWPGDPVISPLPDLNVPWPEGSEDLRSALVIVLGAGGKTCRGFVQQLAQNRASGSGPQGLLEVSSNTESTVPKYKPSFQHRIAMYESALSAQTMNWIESLGCKRIVVCDFGGRNNIVETLTPSLRERFPLIETNLIMIGGEAKVYTAEENTVRRSRGQRLQGTQMNTSGIREEAMRLLGEAIYCKQQSAAFKKVVESELQRNRGTADEGKVLDIELVWHYGMLAVQKAWTEVATGKIPGSQALVFRL